MYDPMTCKCAMTRFGPRGKTTFPWDQSRTVYDPSRCLHCGKRKHPLNHWIISGHK